MSAPELDPGLHAEIKRLCAAGDVFAEAREYNAALAEYNRAWKLVPEPASNWEASTWILSAIGDVSFHLKDFAAARRALDYAMHCPGGLGNAFLHLRLGQVRYEANELDGAADELIRAYMSAGKEIFLDEHPKYLRFLGERAQLEPDKPKKSWWKRW